MAVLQKICLSLNMSEAFFKYFSSIMLLNEFKENNSKNSNKSDLLQDGNPPEIPITHNSSFHEKQFVRMTCLLTF